MEMEEACIVSNCLTMQASSFAGRLFCFTRPPGLRTKTEFIGFAAGVRKPRRRPGRHQYAWRMASMMFSAPTTEIPARVNLLFFFGRIIFS